MENNNLNFTCPERLKLRTGGAAEIRGVERYIVLVDYSTAFRQCTFCGSISYESFRELASKIAVWPERSNQEEKYIRRAAAGPYFFCSDGVREFKFRDSHIPIEKWQHDNFIDDTINDAIRICKEQQKEYISKTLDKNKPPVAVVKLDDNLKLFAGKLLDKFGLGTMMSGGLARDIIHSELDKAIKP